MAAQVFPGVDDYVGDFLVHGFLRLCY
jgi:hypothetical protein